MIINLDVNQPRQASSIMLHTVPLARYFMWTVSVPLLLHWLIIPVIAGGWPILTYIYIDYEVQA